MGPEQYRKIYEWFTARPAALKALALCSRLLPLVQGAAYLALLALLGFRWAAGEDSMRLLARAVLVPGRCLRGAAPCGRPSTGPGPMNSPALPPCCPKRRRESLSPPATPSAGR